MITITPDDEGSIEELTADLEEQAGGDGLEVSGGPVSDERAPVVTGWSDIDDDDDVDDESGGFHLDGRRVGVLVVAWVVVVLLGLGLDLYGLEPLFQQQTQAQLLESYRGTIEQSANESLGLQGLEAPTKAPELGSAVGVLEIGPLQIQQVVVEGAGAAQTKAGPGHVAGTAGLGQPGNAAVVGRQSMFGGPFNGLDQLHKDDRILVTTTQGQAVYKVDTVEQKTITDPSTSDEPVASAAVAASAPTDELTTDALYGKTKDDRLTLVTSASSNPFNSSSGTVVVAKLEGKPYQPTPQNGRTSSQSGLHGDSSAWAAVVLASLAYAAAVGMAVWFYTRTSGRVAYALSAAPIIVVTVLLAEAGSRLLPAWS